MWKWFLYSLILINISFFVWSSRSGIPLENLNKKEAFDDSVQLLLLKEQQNISDKQDKEVEKALACFSVGPFTRKQEARAAQKKLKKWDIQSKRRVQKVSTEGFWVIIPPAKSRKLANSQIKKLKELGIRDYFLVATGSQKNAISLGVFSKSSSAKRRLKQMKDKGVKAKITGVDLPKRSYWLDWPATDAALSADRLAQLQNTFKNIGKVSVKCAE